MGVAKAVLITTLLLLFEGALQLLCYLFFNTQGNPENLDHVLGGTILVARVTAYLIIFNLFWRIRAERKFYKPKNLNPTVLSLIFLIIIASEFLVRPFADLSRLLDNAPANFIYNGYSTYRIYATVTALLIAPVFEELFFRRFLFQKLLIRNGFLTGLLVSSFLFSIIHWETPLNLIPAFIMGIISATIFYKTGNIVYCILLHFLYNASSQMIYYNSGIYTQWLNWLDFGILYWSTFISGIFITIFSLKFIPSAPGLISSER